MLIELGLSTKAKNICKCISEITVYYLKTKMILLINEYQFTYILCLYTNLKDINKKTRKDSNLRCRLLIE